MAVTFVRLALGEQVEYREVYDTADDWYMLRDLDSLPRIFHASEFCEAIIDTWEASGIAQVRRTARRTQEDVIS